MASPIGQTSPNTKTMILDLYIKSVYLKVSEPTTIYVNWQRGNKSVKTRARLVNESVQIAAIEEKYQINTAFDIDQQTGLTVPKLSKLSVRVDKTSEVLGEIDLDLSHYDEGKFRMQRIPLANCSIDQTAYLEVGLRGKNPEGSKPQTTETNPEELAKLAQELEREEQLTKLAKKECEKFLGTLSDQKSSLESQLATANQEFQTLQEQSPKKQIARSDSQKAKRLEQEKWTQASFEQGLRELDSKIREIENEIKHTQAREESSSEVKERIQQAEIEIEKKIQREKRILERLQGDINAYDTAFLHLIPQLVAAKNK